MSLFFLWTSTLLFHFLGFSLHVDFSFFNCYSQKVDFSKKYYFGRYHCFQNTFHHSSNNIKLIACCDKNTAQKTQTSVVPLIFYTQKSNAHET